MTIHRNDWVRLRDGSKRGEVVDVDGDIAHVIWQNARSTVAVPISKLVKMSAMADSEERSKNMPLTEKGKEILANMVKEYGEEKGKEVFYASRNAEKISGVDGDHIMTKLDAACAKADAIVRCGDMREKVIDAICDVLKASPPEMMD